MFDDMRAYCFCYLVDVVAVKTKKSCWSGEEWKLLVDKWLKFHLYISIRLGIWGKDGKSVGLIMREFHRKSFLIKMYEIAPRLPHATWKFECEELGAFGEC